MPRFTNLLKRVYQSRRGDPAPVGKRLPTLKTLLSDATTVWQAVTMERWYGGRDYTVELTSQTAVWDHTGLPPVPIRARTR